MIRFVLLVAVVAVAVGSAIFFSAPLWLPALNTPQGQIDPAKLLDLLKLLPAAFATAVASLIAGGTSSSWDVNWGPTSNWKLTKVAF